MHLLRRMPRDQWCARLAPTPFSCAVASFCHLMSVDHLFVSDLPDWLPHHALPVLGLVCVAEFRTINVDALLGKLMFTWVVLVDDSLSCDKYISPVYWTVVIEPAGQPQCMLDLDVSLSYSGI